MADVTEERIVQAVENVKAAFADGFQLGDIATVVQEVTVFSEAFDLTGPEKKELAMKVAKRILDETDTPWLPDALVDPLILKLLPNLIDLVVSATKGGLELNKPSE